MKRILSVIVTLMFLICGCNGETNIIPIKTGIEFSATATYYNETYECDCDIQKNGDMTVKFTYPADIEGLKFIFTDNGVSVNFKEIEYINEKIIFENSVASLIYEVLVNNNAKVYENDEVFYIEGVNNDFEYKLELGATGLPIKIITRPDIASVEFENVKII